MENQKIQENVTLENYDYIDAAKTISEYLKTAAQAATAQGNDSWGGSVMVMATMLRANVIEEYKDLFDDIAKEQSQRALNDLESLGMPKELIMLTLMLGRLSKMNSNESSMEESFQEMFKSSHKSNDQ